MESKNGLKIIGKIVLPENKHNPKSLDKCDRCGSRHRWLIFSSMFNGNVCNSCLIELDNECEYEEDDFSF